MKKLYETPSVEKLAFRYRDQVVAASGGTTPNASASGWNNNLLSGCVSREDIDDYFWSSGFLDICSAWA